MNTAIATIGDNERIRAYDPIRQKLEQLKKDNAVTFNYADPEENKKARSHVYKLRQERADLDRIRKAEKAESIATGKRIDAQATELENQITALIDVHAKPLEELEEREKARKEAIKERLLLIQTLTVKADPFGGLYATDVLRVNLEKLKAIEITAENFGDSLPDAVASHENSIIVLERHIADAEKRDAEKAELERLRREQEDRDRRDREERIAKEAAERATREGEEKAKRDAEAERKAAEKREQDLRDAVAKAERERLEAEERTKRIARETEERLERERKEEQARQEREAAKLKAEDDRKAANKAHQGRVNKAAAEAFVANGFTDAEAKKIVTLIAQGVVPAITVNY
jgi:hypothetical protein